jgi:hypothetical protein
MPALETEAIVTIETIEAIDTIEAIEQRKEAATLMSCNLQRYILFCITERSLMPRQERP